MNLYEKRGGTCVGPEERQGRKFMSIVILEGLKCGPGNSGVGVQSLLIPT